MSGFPTNIRSALKDRLLTISGVDQVVLRGVHLTDPTNTLGIATIDWIPVDFEMQGVQIAMPTLARWRFVIQSLVKSTDEEEAQAAHDELTKSIRSLLYLDQPLLVSLRALVETIDGRTESVKRWGVKPQKFNSDQLRGEFTHLSATEFWVETETR